MRLQQSVNRNLFWFRWLARKHETHNSWKLCSPKEERDVFDKHSSINWTNWECLHIVGRIINDVKLKVYHNKWNLCSFFSCTHANLMNKDEKWTEKRMEKQFVSKFSSEIFRIVSVESIFSLSQNTFALKVFLIIFQLHNLSAMRHENILTSEV